MFSEARGLYCEMCLRNLRFVGAWSEAKEFFCSLRFVHVRLPVLFMVSCG